MKVQTLTDRETPVDDYVRHLPSINKEMLEDLQEEK